MSTYQLQKVNKSIPIDAKWNKAPWNSIKSLQIKNYMGDKPKHIPAVEAKLAYDDEAIYVIFRVADRYVRAVRTNNQEGVFKDSCVEFFFSPEEHSDNGYFNLEMNCGGTMLFHHQVKPRTDSKHISDEDIDKIQVAHSLPKTVDPEITAPTVWTVEYRIPFEILTKYHDLEAPTAGTVWRGNLYKCADETSHPHWLTWAPIDFPRPNFHLPEFFGTLIF
ncbi:MAG: carbohydrate-binding family 9-like protein [Saprospiraceae bacterium]|nr:carbohydrate-binding family 9-like protein [Saprospiraceae bacterium]